MSILKRIAAIVSVTSVLLTLTPLTVAADSTDSIINVTGFSQSFDPAIGQTEQINYAVTQQPAEDVMVKIYRFGVTVPGRQCNDSQLNYIATIDGPTYKPVGSYSAYWDGKIGANLAPAGYYCFQIRWGNAPFGVSALREGIFAVNTPAASNGGTPGGTPPGGTYGNGTGPANTGSTACTLQSSPVISHCVNPSTIDPSATPPQSAIISYRINSVLSGMALKIRSPGGSYIRTLYSTSYNVNTGNYSASWNGKYLNNDIAPAGAYAYVFLSNGAVLAEGVITVLAAGTGGGGDGVTGAFVQNIIVNPAVFAPNINQTTAVSYTITRNVTNFLLRVRDQAGNFIAALDNSASKTAGQYTIQWDGKYLGNAVSPGTYTFVFEAAYEQPVTATVTVASSGQTGVPVITDLGANPSTISQNQSTTISYLLSQDARVDVTILSGSTTVRRLLVSGFSNNGFANITNTSVWDGRNDSYQYVAAGTYTYYIQAQNSNGVAAPRSGVITVSGANAGTMDVSNLYADPNPFNADTQNTLIRFTLNNPANITATVTRSTDNAFVRTLVSNTPYSSGVSSVGWSGNDSNGTLVSQGNYTVKVEAQSAQYGYDSADVAVTINRSGGCSGSSCQALIVNDYGPSPRTFDPAIGESTQINFSTNMTPGSFNVRIYRTSNNTQMRELPVYTMATNSYRAEWNGRDSANNIVSYDTYTYRIFVGAQGQTVERSGAIYVSEDGVFDDNDDCGNFTDVDINDPLCDAIEFVRDRGIFAGYPDGTIGLNRVIQRAEMLAVSQKAFDYPLDSYSPSANGTLGYLDLAGQTNEWYMPYLKTFKRHVVMVGYPDRRVRAERTISRAELYLVFLKAALAAPGNPANFTVDSFVRFAPYFDTPVQTDTYWYVKYAAFAKLNALVDGSYFAPSEGITRGEVIKLIYDTYLKGLINY